MRVFIGVGHGGSDPGAVKYVNEADANLIIALELKRVLEANGFTVGISRTRDEDDSLSEEIREANAFKPDLAFEVHNNAGGGDGFEVYVQTNGYASKSKAAAKAVEARVKALGQKSRGIKTKKNSSGTADYFGWLRNVKAPAILTEGFFVDSSDAYGFDTTAKLKALAKAYALGVLDYFGVKESATPTMATTRPVTPVTTKAIEAARSFLGTLAGTYTVTASWLNVRSGAGTGKDILTTIPKGTKVRNYGYFTTVDGVRWLYIQFTYNKVTYTGFASGAYLKK